MPSHRLKSVAALALSVAMLCPLAACGTVDDSDSTSGYDVSGVTKDDAIASLVPDSVKSDGKLSVGMELSYAPAEFVAADGKTPLGYDVDLSKALARVMGLEPDIVSSMFDTIVPSVGARYDLGITAMTITPERMEAVDFVSYYRAGSTWAVRAGNPKHVDVDHLCGLKVAVQTGTVQESEAWDANEQCPADNQIEVLSFKQQADAAVNVVSGKADAFYADTPVAGYAITKTEGRLEAVGGNVGVVKQGIAIKKGDAAMAQAVQKAMTKLMDDGTYMDILRHWGVESGALDKAEINPVDLA